jgi:hypothetical protein
VALLDNATLIVNAGNYFTAAVSTAPPADPTAPEVAWTNLGHTSLEEILASESEGGEATVIGTLQNKNLRVTRTQRSEAFTINLQQFDEESLKLYYGSNMVDVASGQFLGANVNPTPTERAFLAVYVDSSGEHFAMYCPRAEIFRGDDMALEDTESLASLPLRITPLTVSGNDYTVAFTPIGGEGS